MAVNLSIFPHVSTFSDAVFEYESRFKSLSTQPSFLTRVWITTKVKLKGNLASRLGVS